MTKIIRITDADPDIIATIRAMDEVMSAPAMDQRSHYGVSTSRYMIILKHDASIKGVKEAVKELGVTIVEKEFG